MQMVEIVDDGMTLTEFHCPFCGIPSFSKDAVQGCKHLVYLNHSETLDKPWVGNNEGLWQSEGDEDLDIWELLERKYPGPDTLLVILSDPPLSGGSLFILYRFPEIER